MKKRGKSYQRRHDKCVQDFCNFMNEGVEDVKKHWKPLKKKHFGHSVHDVECGDLWSELRIDIKTTNRGFKHHSLLATVQAKYGGVPVVVSRETYKKTGAVVITWDFFRELIRIAEKEERNDG